jgi:hypothetical protein
MVLHSTPEPAMMDAMMDAARTPPDAVVVSLANDTAEARVIRCYLALDASRLKTGPSGA